MSLINLQRFQIRHPKERDAIARLEGLFKRGEQGRYTLDQLADRIHANSRDELAILLGELAGAGILHSFLQVRSPRTNLPIGSYNSLGEIPPVIKDKSSDTEFVVNLEDVYPIYEIPERSEK